MKKTTSGSAENMQSGTTAEEKRKIVEDSHHYFCRFNGHGIGLGHFEEYTHDADFAKQHKVYGYQWGNPEKKEDIMPWDAYAKKVKEAYVLPYDKPDQIVLELGPGGGRWTRYFTKSKKVIAVDYYKAILDQLKESVDGIVENLELVHCSGYNLEQVPDASIDLVFTYDCLVHLEVPIIRSYVEEFYRVLKKDTNAIIHYSDSNSSEDMATHFFTENNYHTMKEVVEECGFSIEETFQIPHSQIMVLSKR